ncbi:hypothetical protein EJ08DRAFT_699109 [Tothia fuscella]|uniref:Uncharacterized protein n=1 Tax=Tothia fuscella TaxID=1048955 RepID=A0A9P4NMZ4_9PEZI|nr:hypothetical protein EJ08DRAFT_699109 [Tothia fuscella]
MSSAETHALWLNHLEHQASASTTKKNSKKANSQLAVGPHNVDTSADFVKDWLRSLEPRLIALKDSAAQQLSALTPQSRHDESAPKLPQEAIGQLQKNLEIDSRAIAQLRLERREHKLFVKQVEKDRERDGKEWERTQEQLDEAQGHVEDLEHNRDCWCHHDKEGQRREEFYLENLEIEKGTLFRENGELKKEVRGLKEEVERLKIENQAHEEQRASTIQELQQMVEKRRKQLRHVRVESSKDDNLAHKAA